MEEEISKNDNDSYARCKLIDAGGSTKSLSLTDIPHTPSYFNCPRYYSEL